MSGNTATWFRPGQSGNPAGRPKGARHRLGERFLQAMADDFAEHGADVIRQARNSDPTAYLAIIARVLPKVPDGDDGGGPMVLTIRWARREETDAC
ncbi:MAG TPA: DUF5681 domain-containing protein [Acetobacteraceae bacterium]|nr:DUF5681 domain-containing protein [Acetobacteraceae bacterium]